MKVLFSISYLIIIIVILFAETTLFSSYTSAFVSTLILSLISKKTWPKEFKKYSSTRIKQVNIYYVISLTSIYLFYSYFFTELDGLKLVFGRFSLFFSGAFINCLFFDNLFSNGKSDFQKVNWDTESDAKNAVKYGLGKCPSCFREISRLATKCPHCTADL